VRVVPRLIPPYRVQVRLPDEHGGNPDRTLVGVRQLCGKGCHHVDLLLQVVPHLARQERNSSVNVKKKASSEKSVGHRYAPMGAGSSARAAREPDVG